MVRVRVHDVEIHTLKDTIIPGRKYAEHLSKSPEAFSHTDTQFLSETNIHPLIWAVHTSFSQHIPIQISPDVIFNVILQGVATHIKKHKETYRTKFVSHVGEKKELVVTTFDNMIKGDWNNDWSSRILSISKALQNDMCGDIAKTVLTTKFSTTTLAEEVAHIGVFMNVVKRYYKYMILCICGIPYIDILGCKEDWVLLGAAIEPLLLELDLDLWNTDIQGILQHFIDAFDDKIDVSFWDTIYKYHGKAYGGKGNVSGWISKLFYGNSSIGNQEYIEHSMESFGNGLKRSTFDFIDMSRTVYKMNLHAGVVGVSIQNNVIKPEVGWFIEDYPEKRDEISKEDYKNMKYPYEYNYRESET